MVRIVSGVPDAPEFDSGAILRGFEKGAAYRQKQQAAEQDQISQALRMKEIQMRFQAARAKQEELLAHKAQMGDAHAVQEMVLRSQLPESDKMSQDLLKALENTDDPQAHAMIKASGEELLKVQRKKEQTEAFQTMLQNAAKDGLIDPNPNPTDPETAKPGALPTIGDYMARRDAGENMMGLSKEIFEARKTRAEKAANVEENATEYERAKADLLNMPPGRERTLGMIALKEYEASPSLQEKKGEGAKLRAGIREIAVGPQSQYDAIQEANRAFADQKPAPGLGGMNVGERNRAVMAGGSVGDVLRTAIGLGGPKVGPFTGGTHATVKRGHVPVPIKAAIGQAVDAAPSAEHFMEQLRQSGIDPNSDEGALLILESLKGGNASESPD